MQKILFLFTLLLTLLANSCTKNKPLVTVGDYEITEKEAKYRDRVIHVYYPEDNRSLGLEQLTKAFTYAQILKNNGYSLAENIIKQEEDRIDKNTLVPESLSRIKGIFADDTQSYRKVFILPTLVERVIYFDFFLKNPVVQAKSLSKATDFLNNAKKSPEKMEWLASMQKYKYKLYTLNAKEGLVAVSDKIEKKNKNEPPQRQTASAPPQLEHHLHQQMQDQKREETKKWIKEIIGPLKANQVYEKLIDQDQQWWVVKSLGQSKKTKDTYSLEVVSIPKLDYGVWLDTETKKVKITRN